MRAAASALALALVVALARPAAAEVTIPRYVVDVTPAPDAATARFRVRLEYAVVGEQKTSGFKFVGQADVANARAYDGEGNALALTVTREAPSNEVKLEFALPPVDDRGRQVVVLEFDQDLPTTGYGWNGVTAPIPWAHRFRVDVGTMEVHVYGPRAAAAPGFSCAGAGSGRRCSRVTTGTRAAAVGLARADGGAGELAVLLAALLAAAAGLYLVVRRRHQKLLDTRGVIPPAAPAAYYATETAGYRAPPPFPVQQAAATPVLPAEDRNAFLLRVAGAAVALVAFVGLVAFAADGVSPVPVPIALAGLLLVGVALVLLFLQRDAGLAWLPLSLPVAGAGLLITSSFFGMLFAVVPLVGGLLAQIPAGTFAGSGDGSSSSCGGGGGSCGGGGGGCGGGGGGGGCGG